MIIKINRKQDLFGMREGNPCKMPILNNKDHHYS